MRRILMALGGAVLAACSSGMSGESPPSSAGSPRGVTATPGAALADAYTPLVASVLGPASTFPFRGTDGKYHIVYDLVLLNASRIPATLQSLAVVDAAQPSRVIASFEGRALVDRLRTLAGEGGAVTDAAIEPSAGRILYVDLVFDAPDLAPRAVQHRVRALGAANPGVGAATPLDYVITPYDIAGGVARVLGPPLRGAGWVALNGCCAPGWPHRSSDAPVSGRIVNGQRFAIDWKRMNAQGAFYVGDRTRNESYVDYGAEILAVADGTVVETLDALEPNVPGILPARDPILARRLTLQTVEGNHIVMDLGHGLYAFYAHLMRGSLAVKTGDLVKRGDRIARLGNTGNSNASHLHFQVMDGPSPLASYGVPYVIGGFDYAGQVSLQQLVDADDHLTGTFGGQRLGAPQPRRDELPLAWAIVDFPG